MIRFIVGRCLRFSRGIRRRGVGRWGSFGMGNNLSGKQKEVFAARMSLLQPQHSVSGAACAGERGRNELMVDRGGAGETRV